MGQHSTARAWSFFKFFVENKFFIEVNSFNGNIYRHIEKLDNKVIIIIMMIIMISIIVLLLLLSLLLLHRIECNMIDMLSSLYLCTGKIYIMLSFPPF